VTDGEARLADGTIAGSTLTMGVAVKRAVQQVGMTIVDAANAASLVPATLLGVDDRFGSIQVGRAADLVITDEQLNVRAVMVGGAWVRPLTG
jgi:N-acetylglucosamine-6-phosphate deacetylase